MLSFTSDYIAGAHPALLQKLVDTNLENLSGYGTDPYTERAKEKIKTAFACPDGDVHFVVGGTQTNQLVISTVLQPYEGVISAQSGHVNVHEAGAIEYIGHKVIPLPAKDGKLAAEDVRDYLMKFYDDSSHEHMVIPGMVYISFPTEYGTLYTKEEMTKLHNVCEQYDIPLYVDGARLGYGLCSLYNEIAAEEIANLCDIFYVGGTKVGALCGEAIVFPKGNSPKYMMTQIKQHGALLAKGRVLGIQFDVLFTDDLYFEISKHAIDMAEKLKKLFVEKGYRLFLDSPTNQQFIILENGEMERLKESVQFEFWERFDQDHTVVRFATSWSTTQEHIDALAECIGR